MAHQAQRVALVTGATSGIGLAVAKLLGEQGDHVFLCARGADSVTATVKQLRQSGLDVDGATCDVRDPGEVGALVRAAVERYGDVEILVNNTPRSGGGATSDIPHELWFDVINTNLNSVFLMTREVLTTGGMRNRRSGRIINITSTAGRKGSTPGAPYFASKLGVVGFSQALGGELARTGITVNTVCPGFVETPLPHGEGPGPGSGAQEADVLQRYQQLLPRGRYSTPEEVAGMVGYLASEIASSITGQAFNIYGRMAP